MKRAFHGSAATSNGRVSSPVANGNAQKEQASENPTITSIVDHRFWQAAEATLNGLSTKQFALVVKGEESGIDVVIVSSHAEDILSNSGMTAQTLELEEFLDNREEWLDVLDEKDTVELSLAFDRKAFVISGKHIDSNLYTALGIDLTPKAEKKPIPEKINRLKFFKANDFESSPEQAFRAVNETGMPKAIRNDEGQTLALVMPVAYYHKRKDTPGGTMSKDVSVENLKSGIEDRLLEVSQEKGFVVARAKNRDAVGVMASGENEQKIANRLPREHIVIEDAPVQGPEAQEAPAPVDAAANASQDYAYQVINYTHFTQKVARFRRELLEGKVKVFADHTRGFGIFLPENLILSVPEDRIKNKSVYGTKKLIDEGAFLTSGEEIYVKAQAHEMPIRKRSSAPDYSPKNPYGFVSWSAALRLEKEGLIPEIPSDIKTRVERELKKVKGRKKPTNTASPAAEPTTPAAAPAATSAPAPTPAPTSPKPPVELPATASTDAVTISIGKAIEVDTENLDIAGRLAALKAAKALSESIAQVKELLKDKDAVQAVKVGDKKVYVTAIPDVTANVATISEVFGLQSQSFDISDKNETEANQQWSNIFATAASTPDQLTVISDKAFGKDIVLMPDNPKIKDEVMPALGITLE